MADIDPNFEPEFDTFSLVFPLPYRVATIIVLAVWAWGLNLQYLKFLRIDVPALINYPPRTSAKQTSLHLSTYRLATLLTIPLVASLPLFWILTGASIELVPEWEVLPNLYLLGLVLAFLLPIRQISRNGRYWFLSSLRRVSIGGLALQGEGRFGDILLADVLTSYAKVFGDLFITMCMLFTRKHSTAHPDRNCGGKYMVPLVITLPFLIRFRQCMIEYFRVRKSIKNGTNGVNGWGGQHLANALKYSSAFPVVILSAMQRGSDPAIWGMTDSGLFHLWVFFAFVNSFYSFYWDVAKDWDLHMFSGYRARNSPEHPWGLRRHRYFHAPEIYYVVIVMDLLLRCTWSFKLSPHLDHFGDLEGGIFLMELLEVFRRWVWIFFRVETEWVRNNRGPAPDDILLGDFDGKLDDD